MKTLGILAVLALLLLLAGCGGPATTTQSWSWSQSGSASCSGLLCINSGNVYQEMPQARADNTLLAAALLAVGCVLLVALAFAGAL
jgi:hypothetical protein